MRARITKADLESSQLSWKCIEPMLLSVRGKDLASKAAVYDQLNEGQRALYLFYAFHNHVHSVAEFYWFAAYSIIELKSWDGLKNGLRYLNNMELVQLLEQIERLIESENKLGEQWAMPNPSDIAVDNELFQEAEKLFCSYKLAAEEAIAKLNGIILSNPDDFIEETD
ncbi:hypothetical protein [Paenibacillus harenae]|uniref:HEPN domain-containing protein n=1 Tax=Paenibacillus harenae TaxID=306543 RepID=A0ABT9U229_PAEHA|nr:hypothetical protein [Paenibacillus harenae]MDQ0112374.1 hypothetical protein [Paenibacillus harenae]